MIFKKRRNIETNDKIKPIRAIFERIIINSKKLMKPSESVTIDE